MSLFVSFICHLCHVLDSTYKWYHVFVFLWLTSLNMTLSSSIHVAENVIFHSFLWLSSAILVFQERIYKDQTIFLERISLEWNGTIRQEEEKMMAPWMGLLWKRNGIIAYVYVRQKATSWELDFWQWRLQFPLVGYLMWCLPLLMLFCMNVSPLLSWLGTPGGRGPWWFHLHMQCLIC